MLIWYKMMHNFSYEHNIEHNRLKIRELHPKTISKNLSGVNCGNMVSKIIKYHMQTVA